MKILIKNLYTSFGTEHLGVFISKGLAFVLLKLPIAPMAGCPSGKHANLEKCCICVVFGTIRKITFRLRKTHMNVRKMTSLPTSYVGRKTFCPWKVSICSAQELQGNKTIIRNITIIYPSLVGLIESLTGRIWPLCHSLLTPGLSHACLFGLCFIYHLTYKAITEMSNKELVIFWTLIVWPSSELPSALSIW